MKEEDIIVRNVMKIVPREKLVKLRKLKEIHEYLPASVNGLTISTWEDPARDLVVARTGPIQSVANTPSMGAISKKYSPFAITRLAYERLAKHENRVYSPALQKFEGFKDGKFHIEDKGRGHTNPWQLLDQMLTMGPKADGKRGPNPMPWDIHYAATESVIKQLHAAGVRALRPYHMVLSTEDSKGKSCPFAGLKKKGAAQPFIKREEKKPQKEHWLAEAVNLAKRRLDISNNGLGLWPGTVYKRSDRPAPIEIFKDTEEARELLVLTAKDRAIIAQPFPNQVNEGTILKPVQDKIQLSAVPELDVRTPYHTANDMEALNSWVKAEGGVGNRYTIGVDESGWDHHMTPQGWYAAFEIVRELYPLTLRIGWIESSEFVVFDRQTERKLEEIAINGSITMKVRVRKSKSDGTVTEYFQDVKAGMKEIPTDIYLRRVLAGASSNDILMGDVLISGYTHILDTPHDGKVLTGFGMRSGNWGTFLMNSLVNWYKAECYPLMCKHPIVRAQFKEIYGYDLPMELSIPMKRIRGDDAAYGCQVDQEFAQRIRSGEILPSQLHADLIDYTGGKANAKKQETSDTLGVYELGFAQVFYNEEFPRGISGWTRVMERMIWREDDEATGFDPTTGEDLRHLIGDMGNWSRLSNLFGSFGKEVHPLRSLVISIWQDLDIPDHNPNRMLPPKDEKTRQKLSNLFYSRLLRRGQAPPGSEHLVNIWNTDLGPDLEARYQANNMLRGPWTPFPGKPSDDARKVWRSRIK